jgi:hypothetical protein
MNVRHRIASSALTPVALAGALMACTTGALSPATPTPMPRSQASPAGNVLPLGQTFTSTLYGYTIRYPVTFEPRSATKELQGTAAPLIDSEVVDQLNGVSGGLVVLAAGVIADDQTLDDWTAGTARGFCGTPTSTDKLTLDGEPATLDTFASCAGLFHQWATTVHDGRGFHVVWARNRGTEAADRALFLDMLASFEFAGAAPASLEASGSATGMRPLEPGDPIPDALLGTWYHSAPAFLWVLRAGDPACLELPRTSQDCAIWQRLDGRRLETGILTVVDGRLALQWVQGGCSTTSVYSFGIPVDRLTLRLVSGCQTGDFALTRAGTGDAPSAPPKPGS